MNGWEAWGKFVLKELERLNDRYEELNDRLDEVVIRLIKIERVAWLLGGGLVFVSPVLIWATIELIKSL